MCCYNLWCINKENVVIALKYYMEKICKFRKKSFVVFKFKFKYSYGKIITNIYFIKTKIIY